MRKLFFFCGIGGSGMQALARLTLAAGHDVIGSDRAYDQGTTPEKFARLRQEGVTLYPQDGSGVTADIEAVIVSSAVEDHIPDIQQAKSLGVPICKRAELLAAHFNERRGVAIAGTSGKTTITGMIGWILYRAGLAPTIVNGGIMRNNFGAGADKNFVDGNSAWFVAETDESDGSIDYFAPDIAVLSNIGRDHFEPEQLNAYFASFLGRVNAHVVLNADDTAVEALADHAHGTVYRYAIDTPDADLVARDIELRPEGSRFTLSETASGDVVATQLNVPGRHNIANALAAVAAARCAGVTLRDAAIALDSFAGIARRLEKVGQAGGVTVYDDFAHNPEKIAASLATLKHTQARLHIIFQPHGFAPMTMMREELVASFAEELCYADHVYLPAIYYAGGTATASITSQEIAADLQDRGVKARAFDSREAIVPALVKNAQAGDIAIIMGGRDDSLSAYARDICRALDFTQWA